MADGDADFDDDCCNMDNFEESDSMMDKPHESVSKANQKDTPIKRNALAAKQKNTKRNSRKISPKGSKASPNLLGANNTSQSRSRLNTNLLLKQSHQ